MKLDEQFQHPIVHIDIVTGAGYNRLQDLWDRERLRQAEDKPVKQTQALPAPAQNTGPVYPPYVRNMQRLKAILDDGGSIQDAAAALGWTQAKTSQVQRWLWRLPFYMQICDLAREGYTLTQIAKALGQEARSISGICKRMGLRLSRLSRRRRV